MSICLAYAPHIRCMQLLNLNVATDTYSVWAKAWPRRPFAGGSIGDHAQLSPTPIGDHVQLFRDHAQLHPDLDPDRLESVSFILNYKLALLFPTLSFLVIVLSTSIRTIYPKDMSVSSQASNQIKLADTWSRVPLGFAEPPLGAIFCFCKGVKAV